jgi:hypothetical protein
MFGPSGPRRTDSFRLQKELIFESMPLTAEVPVSLPAVARLPRLPVNDSCVLQRAPRLSLGFRAEGVGR